jgi:hypothetical protein
MNSAGRIACTIAAALLLCATGIATSAPPPAQADGGAAAAQELAGLTADMTYYSSPDSGSTRMGTVAGNRPLTGSQTWLPVIAHATDGDGANWLRVILPGRPNGHTGWISAYSTEAASSDWAITVHVATRKVAVFHDGQLQRTFRAVVGKPSTPTPHGRFFIEEAVKLGGGEVGAPFALALSARSHVLRQFDGGPGQIALHGRDNVGGVPGTAASHGCIRLRTGAIVWLVNRMDSGSVVTITG